MKERKREAEGSVEHDHNKGAKDHEAGIRKKHLTSCTPQGRRHKKLASDNPKGSLNKNLASDNESGYTDDEMANRIPVLSDIVFKYIFGAEDSTEILKSFINAVLKDAGFPPIESVTIANPFNVKTYIDEKPSIIDTRAVAVFYRTCG